MSHPYGAVSARGKGYAVELEAGGARVTLLTSQPSGRPNAATLSLHLLGARHVEPVLSGRLPGVSNYFLGNDPAGWQKGVGGFARATYAGVLPGVDVVY